MMRFDQPDQDALTCRRQVVMCMIVLLTPLAGICAANPVSDLDDVRARLALITSWLNSYGLADHIEIVDVGNAPHPSRPSVSGVHLNARWRGSFDGRERLIDFETTSNSFMSTTGDSIHRKLFFNFARLCSQSLRTSTVHLFVGDFDFATFLEPNGALVTTRTNDSSSRLARAATLVQTTDQVSAINGHKPPDGQVVLDLLADYFAGRRARFRKQEVEPIYIAFSVENLRDEVISGAGLWERIEGTLLMHWKTGELRLYLNLDGQFAAGGIGSLPPGESGFKDMEPIYSKRLQRYAAELLQMLRPRIADLVR
jgi:hypothetical protein